MLDRFERDDEVHARVGERHARDGSGLEPDLPVLAIARARLRNDLRVDVDANDALRDIGEQSAAVAFATRGVEHAASVRVAARERVAMAMLIRDLTGNAGKIPLAREVVG